MSFLSQILSSIVYRIAIVVFCITITSTSCKSQTQESRHLVRDVVDGDTIKLVNKEASVRYIGVDTPETMEHKGKGWVYKPEELAKEAHDFNRSLVMGKEVKLEFDVVKEDKYNRPLAYVYVDDRMVNYELIRNGFSLAYTIPPNIKHAELFLKAQDEAEEAKKGLWEKLKTISADDVSENIGRYCTVKGRLTHVFVSPRRISFTMTSGENRPQLNLVIFSSNLFLFTKKGIDPVRDYKDKEVEVVGKIKYKDGLVIIIDNPSQVRVFK